SNTNVYSTVALANLTGNGKLDLILAGGTTYAVQVFMGNGDGTFQMGDVSYPAGRLGLGLAIADITGDGIPDIINTALHSSGVAFVTGKADGTFTPNLNTSPGLFSGLPIFPAGGTPVALAIADIGSQVTLPDGTAALGPADGHPDIILADSGVTVPGESSFG